MTTIGFQTSCYESSYKHLLRDGMLEHYLSLFGDNVFTEKTVMVNNVYNRELITSLLNILYPDVNYYFTDVYTEQTLNNFNLSLDDFNIGLFYSIQHFTGIYHTNCDYLFHVSEDCNIDSLNSDFIYECVDVLESSDKYIVALPRWCDDPNAFEVAGELNTDKFISQLGFTDNVYLIKTKVFKDPSIYFYHHPYSERYPTKGGDCWEKRIDSFMRIKGRYGIVNKSYKFIPGYYDNKIKR